MTILHYRSQIRKLVDKLFRNGAGTEATRLVLVVDHPDPKVPYLDIGGWSKPAVLDRITTALSAAEREGFLRGYGTTKPKGEDSGGAYNAAVIQEVTHELIHPEDRDRLNAKPTSWYSSLIKDLVQRIANLRSLNAAAFSAGRADQAAQDAEFVRAFARVNKNNVLLREIAAKIESASPDPDYASRVRAEQREADAAKCDVIATENSRGTFNDCSREVRSAESCASAIRREGDAHGHRGRGKSSESNYG